MRRFLRRVPDGMGQAGFQDHSASFGPGSGLILTGGLPISPGNQLAVVWWAIQDSVPANKAFMWGQIKDQAASTGDQIQCSTDTAAGGPYRTVMWASDGTNSSTGDIGVVANTWAMYTSVYDPTTFPPNPTMGQEKNTLGFAFSSTATALMRAAAPGTSFYVGLGPSAAGWQNFPGRIDAMFLFEVASGILPPNFGAGVTALYNGGAGFNSPRDKGFPAAMLPQLLAAYPFDEPTGSTIWHDVSGNGHHLTAVGTVTSGNKRNT